MILRQFPVKLAALLFSVTLSAAPVVGQRVPVGDPLEDYIRVLQAVGRADPAPLSIRPLSLDRVLRSIGTVTLRRNGRQVVEEHFSVKPVAGQIGNILRGVSPQEPVRLGKPVTAGTTKRDESGSVR